MSQAQGQHIAELITRIINSNAENEAAFEHSLSEKLDKHLGKPMPKLSIAECHVIEAIGTSPDITAAKISEALGITRGGISKIVKRLEAKGYVATSAKTDNKKEMHLSLTSAGKAVFDIHEKMHRNKVNRIKHLLAAYTDDELDTVIRLLQDLIDLENL